MGQDLFRWLKEQHLKRKTRLCNARPMIDKLVQVAANPDPNHRKATKLAVLQSFQLSGKAFLERAYFDGTLTEMEFVDILDKYELDISEMGVILACVYGRIDEQLPPKKKFVLVTAVGSPIDLARVFIKKRFGVSVITMKEMMETKEYKKFMKERKEKSNIIPHTKV